MIVQNAVKKMFANCILKWHILSNQVCLYFLNTVKFNSAKRNLE